MEFEKLARQYKESCIRETKRDLNNMINNFIDDDDIDKNYKVEIINMIVCLLKLKSTMRD